MSGTMFDGFFRVLASEWLPWVLSATILFAALVVWLRFRARLEPVLRGLDQAIQVVEETEGPGAFRQRFAAIYRTLAENRVLGEAWQAYATTLRPVPTEEDAIGYLRRPHEHFTDELLTLSGVNLRFYHAFPNLLIGAGLLFTFIGIIGALYFASAGVAAADVQAAQAALHDLLGAATFKFATSVAGLASSLVFSWREKVQLHRFQRRLARFCNALEARTVPITGAGLASAQLAELRGQRRELERLGRNLLVQLPESAEKRLGEELTAAFAPLRTAVRALADRLGADEGLPSRLLHSEPGSRGGAGGRGLRGGLEPVAVTGSPAAPLLSELRAIRKLLEGQVGGARRHDTDLHGTQPSSSGSPAAGAASPGSAGWAGLSAQLARLGAAVRAALARIAGSREVPLRQAELEAIARELEERVSAVREMLNGLPLTASPDGQVEEPVGSHLRTTLRELQSELDRSQQALAAIVADERPPRDEAT